MTEQYKLVPVELLDRFPEINLSNYGPDDVDALNAWGIEVALAAAPEQPSPAEPLDREAIRNAALESAIDAVCEYWGITEAKPGLVGVVKAIRAKKSQPAQPSDISSDMQVLLIAGIICKVFDCPLDQSKVMESARQIAAAVNRSAQPSDSQAEPSDTEILDWLIRSDRAVISGGEIAYEVGKVDVMDGGISWSGHASTDPLEAIKAAMRAQGDSE